MDSLGRMNMGQYWKVANLDKKEFIVPHMLGVGLKLGEQIGSGHGTPDAIFILVAAMRERRGVGDFDWDSNYYGPERTNHWGSAPVNDAYNEVATRTIGRWAGDRIVVVGDYSEDGDLPSSSVPFGQLYHLLTEAEDTPASEWRNITADVAKVIEHEVGGEFIGDGWKEFKRR